MTADWFEDLAERLIEASEYCGVQTPHMESRFRLAACTALDMAVREQDQIIDGYSNG